MLDKEFFESFKVEQHLYFNLNENVHELYPYKLNNTKGMKYIGVISELMTRLSNLEETNEQLEFQLRQRLIS